MSIQDKIKLMQKELDSWVRFRDIVRYQLSCNMGAIDPSIKDWVSSLRPKLDRIEARIVTWEHAISILSEEPDDA